MSTNGLSIQTLISSSTTDLSDTSQYGVSLRSLMSDNTSDISDTPQYGGDTDHISNGSDIIFGLLAALFIGLAIKTIGGLIPRRFLLFTIPYTALMFLFGFCCGLVERNTPDVPYWSEGLRQLESISPSVIFAVFLPALVFPSGLTCEWHLAARTSPYGLLMAGPGTLIAAGLIALTAHNVFPYGWSWSESFLFGGIVSAVDPVAVISIMKSVGASAKLSTVIEIESLLNDGVAYVLYEVFKGWAAGELVTASGVIVFCIKAVFGGLGMGLAFGICAAIWLALVFNQVEVEISITLVTVYSLWLLCDEVLGFSGMLALVFCSIFMGAFGKYYASRSSAANLEFFWSYVDWAANTVIFFLSGLIIAEEIAKSIDDIDSTDLGYAFLLWVFLFLIRLATVILFYPLLRRGSYGLNWKDGLVLSWAGLRGAVGLTLSLIVYQSPDVGDSLYRSKQFFMMGMMATFTLFIQGATTGPLLRWLGYMDLPPNKAEAMRQAAGAVEKLGQLQIDACREKHSILGEADWQEVEKLTDLGIVKTVNQRKLLKQKQRAGHLQKKIARSAGNKYTEGEVVDLRERLLSAVKAAYAEIFSSDHLSGADMFALQETVEKAMDEADEGLKDWDNLKAKFSNIQAMDLRGKTCSKWNIYRKGHYRWQLHSLKVDAMRVASFIYAHSHARKLLMAFADLGHGGLIDLETGRRDSKAAKLKVREKQEGEPALAVVDPNSNGAAAGNGDDPNNQVGAASVELETTDTIGKDYELLFDADDVEDYAPFWHMGDHSNELVTKAVAHLRNSNSLYKRMTSFDSRMLDVAKNRVLQVVEESCKEQAHAEKRMIEIKNLCPEAVRQVRTTQVIVKVLREESEFVEKLHKCGMLEENEADAVLKSIEMRMKHISAIVSLD